MIFLKKVKQNISHLNKKKFQGVDQDEIVDFALIRTQERLDGVRLWNLKMIIMWGFDVHVKQQQET